MIPTTPARTGQRFRISLGDLMIWVLGAAIVAAVCRGARPASWWNLSSIDVARLLGVGAAFLVVFAGIGLSRHAWMWWQRRRTERFVLCLAAVAWRVVVVAVLGTALVVEVGLLGSDVGGDDWSDARAVRLRLLPLVLTLALAGILGGVAPGRDRAAAPGRPRRMVWLSVVCTAVTGVIIVATQAVIPYIILLALNAVHNAMPGPFALQPMRPDLNGRLLRAGVEAAPVLGCCLALGLLVARELQRRPGDAGVAWRGDLALLAATTAAGLGAAWLTAVSIPRLDECLTEAIGVTIDPLNVALIAFGFAGLALGIAARATERPGHSDPAGTEERPRAWFWRVMRNLVIALILLDFVAARGFDLIVARRAAAFGIVQTPVPRWIGWVDAAFDYLQMFLGSLRRRVQPWYYFEAPEWLALALAMGWVAWWVLLLLATPIGTDPSPIDACLGDRRTLGRFAIRWLALSVLMAASLPTLFLAGLVFLHSLFRGLEGWN